MFNIDNIPTLTLSFIPNLNATANQPHFHLSIEKIIEYYDANNNGRYDRNDIIASSISFSDITFTEISYTNTTNSDGNIIYNIETHTIDNIFALSIYIATNETSLNNNIITPEEMKMDFIIANYSFLNQTTRLALVTQLETHNQYKFEEKSYDEKVGIARRAYKNFAKMTLEYMRFPAYSLDEIFSLCSLEGGENIDWVLRNGKGGVVVAGHFGNWELMGAVLALSGYPISFLVGEQHNKRVDERMNRHRQLMGIKIIHMGVAVRGVIKTLRNNEFEI